MCENEITAAVGYQGLDDAIRVGQDDFWAVLAIAAEHERAARSGVTLGKRDDAGADGLIESKNRDIREGCAEDLGWVIGGGNVVARHGGMRGKLTAVVAQEDVNLAGRNEAAHAMVYHTVRGGEHRGGADQDTGAASHTGHVDLGDGGPGKLGRIDRGAARGSPETWKDHAAVDHWRGDRPGAKWLGNRAGWFRIDDLRKWLGLRRGDEYHGQDRGL